MFMKMIMYTIFMFLVGLFSFFIMSNYLMKMLLSLEYLSLVIFLLMFFSIWLMTEKYILMYFLTFCVCEGAFGLSILVMMVRSYGNDYLNSIMFLKC
uniref:NADH-ubiquinone oxidoreductase chain 4L n=1 Tax=Ectopsocopsis cryptomeriae TaxID=297975 RepID=A0A8K1ZFD9_9NEOP|nr:NADH dehydrogenase subunit 4L [Ectopsocopsis cryptomeriae]